MSASAQRGGPPLSTLALPALLALLALSSFGGCDLSADAGGVPVFNDCFVNEDCSSSICDLGICIAASSSPVDVALELLPASSSGEAQAGGWIFGVEVIDGPTALDLSLPTPLTVHGDVKWNGTSIPAQLTFTRPSALPAGNDVRVRTTSEAPSMGSTEPAYSVEVVAGQSYEVLVQPSALPSGMGAPWTELLPPLRLNFNAPAPDPLQPGAVLSAALPITYPALVTVDARLLDNLEQPEASLMARAVDAVTGRTLSSTSLTTADGGFRLTLPQDTAPYLFVIEGSELRPDYPRVVVDPALLFPGSPVLIHIASVEKVLYRGVVESEDGRPIQNGQVVFRSRSLDGLGVGVEASFEASAVTDEAGGSEGGFELSLLPGSYDVIVTPSGTSCDEYECWSTEELAVLHTTLDVAARPDGMPIQGRLFVTPARAVMGGSVSGPRGVAMFGPAAQAVARQEALRDLDRPEALHNRSSSAETDPTGLFDLRLDRGRFDLFVKHDPLFAFPWVVVPGLEIDGGDEPILRDFEVRLPVPVRGFARDSRGQPLAGAEVRAHALILDEGTSRSVLVGAATVAEDGSYELLLPPEL